MPLLTYEQKLNYSARAAKFGWAAFYLATLINLLFLVPITTAALLLLAIAVVLGQRGGWQQAKKLGLNPMEWFKQYPLLLVPLFIEGALLLAIGFGADLGVYLSLELSLSSVLSPLSFVALGLIVFAGICALTYWLVKPSDQASNMPPLSANSFNLNSGPGGSGFRPFSGQGYRLGDVLTSNSVRPSAPQQPALLAQFSSPVNAAPVSRGPRNQMHAAAVERRLNLTQGS